MISKFKKSKNKIFNKLLVLFITPIVFAILLMITLFLILNFKTDGIVKYLNVFFLKVPPTFTQIESNIFEESSNDSSSVNLSSLDFPKFGTVFGKIEISNRGISTPLIYGDDTTALDRGAGMYMGSSIPGYGGTCLVAGHNTSHFKKLRDVEINDIISITTTYGKYEYKVYNIDVFPDNDKKAYDLKTQDQLLNLYTCYYVNTPVGNVKERLFIYAKLISGPIIIK